MKNAVFWDVSPRGSCRNSRFGGTYRLSLQGEHIQQTPLKRLFPQEPHGDTSQNTAFFTSRRSRYSAPKCYLTSGTNHALLLKYTGAFSECKSGWSLMVSLHTLPWSKYRSWWRNAKGLSWSQLF
jgi:hypothetical protein